MTMSELSGHLTANFIAPLRPIYICSALSILTATTGLQIELKDRDKMTIELSEKTKITQRSS